MSVLDAGIDGWRGVSRRLVWVELARVVVGFAVAGVVAIWAWLLSPWVGIPLLVLVVVVGVIRAVITPRRVRAIGYVLRDDDLVFRRGIFFSRLVAVPYGRMQLIDVNRGPVSRVLGLAELRLVTAAATSNVTIPGLVEQDASALRDSLVERAESRRVGL